MDWRLINKQQQKTHSQDHNKHEMQKNAVDWIIITHNNIKVAKNADYNDTKFLRLILQRIRAGLSKTWFPMAILHLRVKLVHVFSCCHEILFGQSLTSYFAFNICFRANNNKKNVI